ncbi:MAG: ABC transporter permease [Acidobacteria bacterium]|nr:ABC transporter permease [Acidobacteriota bacterium]
MRFVVRMTVRELRASWRRLVFFFVCVAIGVGAIVALRSVIQSVRGELVREARAMIASDVIVSTNRSWDPDVRRQIEERLAQPSVLDRTEAIETATMVRAAGRGVARMVELRGVQAAFPFYGQIELEGGLPYSHDLLRDRGAIARPELLAQLGIKQGDALLIGGQPFTVRAVLSKEPGRRTGAFTFGSRVFVDHADLQRSGLLAFGSRASYQLLLRVEPAGVESLTRTLRRDFGDRFVNARSYRSTEDNISEDMARAENYLSLVGFVIVVLGGIGVWSVTRVFVKQKIRSIAILKCLGATTRQVLATYVAQVLLLGLTGSALGIGLAAIALRAIPDSMTSALGGQALALTGSAVMQGLAVGLLVSLLFSLVPLLEVRRVRPLLLLRGGDPSIVTVPPFAFAQWRDRVRAIDWLQVSAAVVVSAALVGIASWQAASVRVGLIVCGGFAGVALLLLGAGALMVRAVRPLARTRIFALRHAVLGLRRPGNQTRVVLLAVGLGTFFVLGVRALQSNLLDEFSLELDRGGADMFLIDIQQDQVERVRAFLADRIAPGSAPARLIPVLRARVTGVRGREVNLDNFQDVRGRGSLAREYVITYRDHLEANETVIDGEFWSGQGVQPRAAPELQVSIERSIHERFSIGVGDLMRFDVLGRVVQARVTSVRDVEWEDSRNGGFMFVFRPGPLSAAPHTYIGLVRAPDAPTARAAMQHDLVESFPNISAIDVRDVVASVQGIVENVTLAISIVGGIALFGGVLILIGAVAMTKFQRVYEAAILRTLGASTKTLSAMLAGEYTTLGLLAGAIGAAGALVLSWAVCRYVFEIDWRPAPLLLIGGALVTMVLVAVIGVIASADVLRKKPLATLRAE